MGFYLNKISYKYTGKRVIFKLSLCVIKANFDSREHGIHRK